MKFLLLPLFFLLTSCSWLSSPNVTINSNPVPIVAPVTNPPQIQNFTINLIDSKNINTPEWQNNPNQRLVIITENNFKIYLENNIELYRYIDEQESVIKFYENLNSKKDK